DGEDALTSGGFSFFEFDEGSEGLTKTFTIANSGTADLTLDPESISVPEGFEVVSSFAETVAPGESTTLVVRAVGDGGGSGSNSGSAGTLSFSSVTSSSGTGGGATFSLFLSSYKRVQSSSSGSTQGTPASFAAALAAIKSASDVPEVEQRYQQ